MLIGNHSGLTAARNHPVLLLLAVVCALLAGNVRAQTWLGFPTRMFPVAGLPYSVTTGDFNGDGITDLAAANNLYDNVSVLLGNGSGGTGNGTFAAHVTYAAGDGPYAVTTGDFNGDGITDLATSNKDSDSVTVLLNLGFAATSPSAASPSWTMFE